MLNAPGVRKVMNATGPFSIFSRNAGDLMFSIDPACGIP